MSPGSRALGARLRSRGLKRGVAALVLVVLAAVAVTRMADEEYTLEVVMPVADGVYEGGEVMMHGNRIGHVTDVGLRGNKAIVSVSIEDDYAPVPAGTTAQVSWTSVVGRRTLDLVPGPAGSADLASGKLITSEIERVELDDVLAALDAPTRAKLGGLLQGLEAAIDGHEQDLNKTLSAAGPTVFMLGKVLEAVGQDGPALRDLVTRLQSVTSVLDGRDADLRAAIGDLDTVSAGIASKQASLRSVIEQLPDTIDAAVATLDQVPGAVDATTPLLERLAPAVSRLPGISRDLGPAISTLKPTLRELRPTVEGLNRLLADTPGLLDTAHAVVPDATSAVRTVSPAVEFLRPYTPELNGWLTNWTSLFMSQTSGNYARALITTGASALDINPGIVPPGLKQDNRPAPGSIYDQPWIDANGDELR